MDRVHNAAPLRRHLAVSRAAIDEEARTVTLAWASETPYERYFGIEVLDVREPSMRLDRLRDGGPLLLDHDWTAHIGVIEGVEVGDDRVARATVRFGRGARADEAFRDVVDGIRRHVSVSYWPHRMVLESEADDVKTYRVTDWEPLEVSLVAVPADPTVGVGRDAGEGVTCCVEEQAVAHVDTVRSTRGAIQIMDNEQQQQERERQAALERERQSAADAERTRSNAIIALGEQFSRYLKPGDVAQFCRDGRTPEQFREHIMTAMQSAHTDTRRIDVGMSRTEVKRYSIARAILAQMSGDWHDAGLEREASMACARIAGGNPEGFYVPPEAWRRDFNVGTSTEAGNLVATDFRGDLYVDALRANLVAGRMGVRILAGLTGNIDIPVKTLPTTIGMLAERGTAASGQPNVGKVSLAPHRMGAQINYSKQALIQSALALEPMLRDDLLSGVTVLLEQQMLNGAGTGVEIQGLRNTAGIGTVVGGTNGAALTWAHIVDLETKCANANAEPDLTAGYVVNTRVRGQAKTVQRGTNLPFIWSDGEFPLNGYRAGVTNNMPNNLTKGTSTTVCSAALFSSDWSMSVVGLFGMADITVDPYTEAKTGGVLITLNQYADHGCRLAAAFAKMDDILAGA